LVQKKKLTGERKYQRASCDFPGEMLWGTITHPARVEVISIGGCFLYTEALVPEGEEVDLIFTVEDDDMPIKCTGAVVWVTKEGIKVRENEKLPGFALEFKKIYPEYRARIDEYVKKQNRIFKTIDHELSKSKPDKSLVKELFSKARPNDSTHLNHIKKVCRQELRHFRLRRSEAS